MNRELLLKSAGATRGFLYVIRQGRLDLGAAIPDAEAPVTLDDEVTKWMTATFDSDGATTTASLDGPPSISQRPYSFFELLANTGGEVVVAGVAALQRSPGATLRIPNDMLRTVGEELIRAGDASGRVWFRKTTSR